jgi:hypothetical protein
MRSLTTSPGKAGLRVQAGDRHTRDGGAACRGPPVVRERGKSRNSVPEDPRVLFGMERWLQANQIISENFSENLRKLRRLRRPHHPHHANRITSEDSPHRPPRAATGRVSFRVEARRPWRNMCPRWPPPHPERDGAVPGAAGEGKGRCGSPPPLPVYGTGTPDLRGGRPLAPPRH